MSEILVCHAPNGKTSLVGFGGVTVPTQVARVHTHEERLNDFLDHLRAHRDASTFLQRELRSRLRTLEDSTRDLQGTTDHLEMRTDHLEMGVDHLEMKHTVPTLVARGYHSSSMHVAYYEEASF
ncbi:hypothetical protein L1987_32617 [Smallanthus sonchifolius]|uniref:Uncharacterized protein n=1 Tax=Smallanthus sonchifolius TaxID=185202 RepID=A0ACB9HPE8_9ASTR|nr:hypothetical protein L1987_32617 [Smallanthus sonchifolius]